jgi:Zn-dependent alcohol dehydrogenase
MRRVRLFGDPEDIADYLGCGGCRACSGFGAQRCAFRVLFTEGRMLWRKASTWVNCHSVHYYSFLSFDFNGTYLFAVLHQIDCLQIENK